MQIAFYWINKHVGNTANWMGMSLSRMRQLQCCRSFLYHLFNLTCKGPNKTFFKTFKKIICKFLSTVTRVQLSFLSLSRQLFHKFLNFNFSSLKSLCIFYFFWGFIPNVDTISYERGFWLMSCLTVTGNMGRAKRNNCK